MIQIDFREEEMRPVSNYGSGPYVHRNATGSMIPAYNRHGQMVGYEVRTQYGPELVYLQYGESDMIDRGGQRELRAVTNRVRATADARAEEKHRARTDPEDISEDSLEAIYGGQDWRVVGFQVFTPQGPTIVDLDKEGYDAFNSPYAIDDDERLTHLMIDIKRAGHEKASNNKGIRRNFKDIVDQYRAGQDDQPAQPGMVEYKGMGQPPQYVPRRGRGNVRY